MPQHALDELKEQLAEQDDARKTAERARALSDLSVRQSLELAERVRVVEDGFTRIEGAQERILLELGKITSTTTIERWLRILSMVGWLVFVGKTLFGAQ
jgi:hypothetical protein